MQHGKIGGRNGSIFFFFDAAPLSKIKNFQMRDRMTNRYTAGGGLQTLRKKKTG